MASFEELKQMASASTAPSSSTAQDAGGLPPDRPATYEELKNAAKSATAPSSNKLYDAMNQPVSKPNPSNLERAGRAVLGAAEQYAGSLLGTAASYYEGGARGSQAEYERLGELAKEQVREAHESYRSALEKAQYNMDDKDVQRAKRILDSAINEQRMYQTATTDNVKAGLAETADTFYGAANKVSEAGAKNIERAKQGAGRLGSLAIDVGVGGLQMGADIGLAALTGGTNILPIMAARTYGGGALEARNAGASYERQVAYGGAVALTEILTEKLSDIPGLAGGGLLDNTVNRTIRSMANKPAGMTAFRLMLAFKDEAIEEILSDAVNPLARSIYNGKSIRENYSEEKISDWLYSGLVGGILGLGGTVSTQVMRGTISLENSKARIANDAESRLTQRGFDKKTAGNLAELVSQQLSGEELSAEQEAELAKWPTAQEVLSEMQKEGVKPTDKYADKRPGNVLAKHKAARADEKVIARAATANLNALEQHELGAVYEAAYRQGDTALCERVLEEQARRVNEVFSKMSRGEVLDLTADQKALYEKIRRQLRNPVGNEQGRPALYDENTPPASDTREQQQAPMYTDEEAPPARAVPDYMREESTPPTPAQQAPLSAQEQQPAQQPVSAQQQSETPIASEPKTIDSQESPGEIKKAGRLNVALRRAMENISGLQHDAANILAGGDSFKSEISYIANRIENDATTSYEISFDGSYVPKRAIDEISKEILDIVRATGNQAKIDYAEKAIQEANRRHYDAVHKPIRNAEVKYAELLDSVEAGSALYVGQTAVGRFVPAPNKTILRFVPNGSSPSSMNASIRIWEDGHNTIYDHDANLNAIGDFIGLLERGATLSPAPSTTSIENDTIVEESDYDSDENERLIEEGNDVYNRLVDFLENGPEDEAFQKAGGRILDPLTSKLLSFENNRYKPERLRQLMEQAEAFMKGADNGGEQTVQQPSAETQSERTGGDFRTDAAYGIGVQSGLSGGDVRGRDSGAGSLDSFSGSDAVIAGSTLQSYIDNSSSPAQNGDYVFNSGTRRITNPQKGQRGYRAYQVAKFFGIENDLYIFENGSNNCVDLYGSKTSKNTLGLHNGNKIFLFFNNADALPAKASSGRGEVNVFLHELTHMRLGQRFYSGNSTSSDIDFGKRTSAILARAFKLSGIDDSYRIKMCDLLLEKAYGDSYNTIGYRKALLSSDEFLTSSVSPDDFVQDSYRSRVSQEILCDSIGSSYRFGAVAKAVGLSDSQIRSLHKAINDTLGNENVFLRNDLRQRAIFLMDAGTAIASDPYSDITVDDSEETSNRQNAGRAPPSSSFGAFGNVDLNYAVRQAAAGNAESLTDRELRAVLKYAVDRASPETEGQPLIERATNLILENADNANRKARPTNWLYDRGYQGNTVGSLNNSQSQSLVNTVVNILNALDKYGTRIASDIGSDVTDYENQFGAIVDENGNPVDLSQEPKPDVEAEDKKALIGAAAEDQAEADWDRRQKPRIIRDMERGNDVVESFGVNQENGKRRRDIPVSKDEKTTWTVNGRQIEVSGWVTPSEVDSKALAKAEDAVKAKGDEATIKDRIKLLEARKKYLDSVVDQARKARADFYASEDVEQRKADLGYMADNISQQLEQLDADMGYMTDELDLALAEDPNSSKAIALSRALEDAQRQSDNLKSQLESLRDEYRSLRSGDSSMLHDVRDQIDSVINEIRDLSRRLDSVSKRAGKADWGVTKRTVFQGEIARNPAVENERKAMPEPNRTEPLAKNGWPQSVIDRAKALDKPFRSAFSDAAFDFDDNDASEGNPSPAKSGLETTALEKKCANIIDGKGALFESSTDADQAPAHDDLDDPRRKLSKEWQKFRDSRFGNKPSAKPVTPEVSQAMLHLQEDVTGILKSDTPIRHVLNLVESLSSYQPKDSEMNWLTSKEINDTVREIQDAYKMAEEDVDAKAQRMANATAKLLALVSTKVERAETGRADEFAFEEAAEKNGKEATNAFGKARYFHDSWRFNPTTQFKMIDGFDKGSNGVGYQLAKLIENSVAKEQMMTGDVFARYAALQNEKGIQEFAEGKSMCQVPVPGLAINGKPIGKITEQQAVELIKTIKTLAYQEVGSQHRLDTIAGFTFVDKNGNEMSIKRKNLKSSKESSFYQDMLRLATDMELTLSPAAKKYIEITDGILFDVGNETSKVKQQVTGVGFDKFQKGYYYPVRYRSPAHQTDYTDSYERGGLFDPFTDRTKTTGGYVYIGSAADTVDNYIRNAIYAASYADLSDKLGFMNSTALGMRGMANVVGDNYGKSFARAFNNYTNDVAQRFDRDSSGFNQMMGKARSLLQQGALRFSVSVPIKQTASYWDAMGVLSPEALREAYRFKATKAKGYGKGNPILDVRAVGGIDPTLSEILNNKGYLSELKKKSKIADAWDKAISVMDYRTVDDLYHACIIDTGLSYPDLDTDSKMFKDIVSMKFQEVVLNTQPVFNANARSQAARTKNELVRMVSMFQTQQTQNYNRLVTAIGEAKAAGEQLDPIAKRTLRRTVAGQVAAVVEFSLLQMLADLALHRKKQYKEDDDDKADAGKIIRRFLMNAVESAAGTVWLGDQAAKLAIDFVNGDSSNTSGEFRGLSLGPVSSAMSAVDNVVSAADSIRDAIVKRDLSKLNASSIRYGITNTAQLFGIPANNVASAINSIAMYGLDAAYMLSGGKAGNRLGEDKFIKIVNSWIKGDMTVDGAKRQVNKALKREQPENVLYNVGILEAEGAARAKKNGTDDPHSGRDYLSDRLKKIGADGDTPNERIVNYLISSKLSDAEIDKAVDSYVTAYSYNALYDAARKTGMSPKAVVKALDEIDANSNGDIAKSELKNYYKQHGDKSNKLVEALWGAKDYKTIIPDDGEYEKFTAHYDAVMNTGVSAARASSIVDACKNDQGSITQGAIYQYYLAHPDDEEQIKALFESMGYKQNGKAKTWDWFKKNYKPK